MTLEGRLVGGKYRVIRTIGSGGMGTVFEALNVDLGKKVAIKALKPELSDDRSATARFVREARAAAAIGHPNIVDVYDIVGDEQAYPPTLLLVMEHLEGQSLAALLRRRGKLDVGFAAYVACQLLSALRAAHAAGIVHRDIKPENLFLVETGQIMPAVRLLDFGTIMLLREGSPVDHLTSSGVVLGTPYYMAPEQARGWTNLDHRVDLWAVGVVLYECTTGDLPFHGSNYNSVIAAIMTDIVVPPSERDDSVPRALDVVVLRALARDRDERYADADQMFDDLLPLVPERARDLIPGIGARPGQRTIGSIDATAEQPPPDTPEPHRTSTATTRENKRTSRFPRRYWPIALASVLVVAAGTIATASMLSSGPPEIDQAGRGSSRSDLVDGDDETANRGRTPSDVVEAQTEPAATVPTNPATRTETKVSITLLGLPAGARVFLDDTRVDGNVLDLPRSHVARRVRVEAPGYETWRASITPSHDSTIGIEMVPADQDALPSKTKRLLKRPLGDRQDATETSSTDPRLRKNPFDH